jgi:hypothetical protein
MNPRIHSGIPSRVKGKATSPQAPQASSANCGWRYGRRSRPADFRCSPSARCQRFGVPEHPSTLRRGHAIGWGGSRFQGSSSGSRWWLLSKPRFGISRLTVLAAGLVGLAACASRATELPSTPLFTVHEVALQATGRYGNPYLGLEAEVVFTPPDGGANRTAPLFWDGDTTWKFRFSPDRTGEWRIQRGALGAAEHGGLVQLRRPGFHRPVRGGAQSGLLAGGGSSPRARQPPGNRVRSGVGLGRQTRRTLCLAQVPLAGESTCRVVGATGGTIWDSPTHAEVQALPDKCEELADDVRALSTLAHALRGALVAVGVVKGGV